MFTEPKILIVGAGASGFAAACRLLEKGLKNVTILEAKNRIGGRIRSEEFADNIVDLGAQWVHGERGNLVYDLAFPHKLLDSSELHHDYSNFIFGTVQGEVIPKEQSTKAFSIYCEISERADNDDTIQGSYGEYVVNEYNKINEENPFTDLRNSERLLDWIHKYDNSLQSCDSWFEVSGKGMKQYWECEGDSVLNWKYHGYKTVFDLLSHKFSYSKNSLPVMETIEFNKEVSSIDYTSDNSVIVSTKDGSKYTASHVIFTGSLGVLKEKHAKMFIPSLPATKQRAINALSIGSVGKIFLEFSSRWWPENLCAFNFCWTEDEKDEFIRTHGKDSKWLCDIFTFFYVAYQPRVLAAWIYGESARYIETLSDAEVQDGLCLLLDTFYGKTYNITKPIQMLRTNWNSDEHFRGCYSFISMTTEQMNILPKDLAEPILTDDEKPILLFAGEATHDHYFSTVHGAIETGFREADRIIKYHRTRGWLRQVINSFNKTERILRSTNEVTRRTKVVIIGAGIAGLAAAKTLEDANFKDYLLIEAQKEIGGRICSVPRDGGWIESGAQFLHGDRSKLAELCYTNDLLSDIQCRDGQGIFIREDGFEMDKNLVDEIDDLVRTALEDCENCVDQNVEAGSENIGRVLRSWLRTYLHQTGDSDVIKNMKEEIFDWNVRFLMIDNSCFTLDDLSTKYWGKFKFVGGPEHLLFKAGYHSLPKLIANNLNEKNIRLNTAVELVEWRQTPIGDNLGAPIALSLSDKTRVLADCVIITCSLGYLKENYKKMFSPPLPLSLSHGIESLGFGLINKIFLDFGTSWWDYDTKGFQLLWKKVGSDVFSNKMLAPWTRDLTGFDVLPDQSGVLLGWVGGRGAYIVETLSEQQVAVDCINLLRYHLKLNNIPVVTRCMRTQWNANKYVRGSYSHISTKSDSNGVTPATLAEPVWSKSVQNNCSKDVPIMMFAGEATHEHFYSTTHGAYETGVQQAQCFLRHHIVKN